MIFEQLEIGFEIAFKYWITIPGASMRVPLPDIALASKNTMQDLVFVNTFNQHHLPFKIMLNADQIPSAIANPRPW